MRRFVAAIVALFSILLLGACEVHYSGESYELPWYYIAVPVIVFSILCVLLAQFFLTRQTFKCPECETEFHPGCFEFSSWFHVEDARIVRCPKCKRKGFCKKVGS